MARPYCRSTGLQRKLKEGKLNLFLLEFLQVFYFWNLEFSQLQHWESRNIHQLKHISVLHPVYSAVLESYRWDFLSRINKGHKLFSSPLPMALLIRNTLFPLPSLFCLFSTQVYLISTKCPRYHRNGTFPINWISTSFVVTLLLSSVLGASKIYVFLCFSYERPGISQLRFISLWTTTIRGLRQTLLYLKSADSLDCMLKEIFQHMD